MSKEKNPPKADRFRPLLETNNRAEIQPIKQEKTSDRPKPAKPPPKKK